MSASKSNPAEMFPPRATPPDSDGYPHYAAVGEANKKLRSAYERELKARRRTRQAFLKPGSGARKRWQQRSSEVRTDFAHCLGLEITSKPSEPSPLHFEFGVPISGPTSLAATWLCLPAAGWEDEDIEILILRSRGASPNRAGVLLIPDAGPGLMGAESPESAARAWGYSLAASGMLVAIPRFPGYARFSSTHNKWRLLEGACALGEIVGEAARALGALLEQPDLNFSTAWVAGQGVGGLAALMLGALDGRVGGVLADAPTQWGTPEDHDALVVPHSHPLTDLPELAALIAPRPLALIQSSRKNSDLDAPQADVRALTRAARAAYSLLGKSAAIRVFPTADPSAVTQWMGTPNAAPISAKNPRGQIEYGPRLKPRFSVASYTDGNAWKRDARRLRAAYRKATGLPPTSVPLAVEQVGEKRMEDCTRLEYHVQTGPHAWANLTFLRPHGPIAKRTTILCLPGSSSDVARVEDQYAHEVVAEGWNAAIIDARVALMPFHPGIAEERAMITQSLHDLICCLDYVAGREDVDPKRIGTTGVSQGGTHSWMLAAMDKRIAAAVPICGVCTYRSLRGGNSINQTGLPVQTYLDSHGIYYYTPGVLRLAEQQDLCALIAPRPFALVGANRDDCFPLDGMRECAHDLKHIYQLLDAPQNFRYVEFEGFHSIPLHSRKSAYAFFRKHLEGK
jgi:hypothetical protein